MSQRDNNPYHVEEVDTSDEEQLRKNAYGNRRNGPVAQYRQPSNQQVEMMRYNQQQQSNMQHADMLLSQRDRATLTVIDRSVEKGMQKLGEIVNKHGGASVEINERRNGVKVKVENVCFACREYIGTAEHYRESRNWELTTISWCHSDYLSVSSP
jgi:hypothetical protein